MNSEKATQMEGAYADYADHCADEINIDGFSDGCWHCKGDHSSRECKGFLGIAQDMIREQFYKWDAEELPESAEGEGENDEKPPPHYGLAFPQTYKDLDYCEWGLTKREYMATHIAAGMIGQCIAEVDEPYDSAAHDAVLLTDKLMDHLARQVR